MLAGLPLSPVTPEELELSVEPEETGETHEQIAREKAEEWSRQGAMLAIASDGGLVVPALAPVGKAATPTALPGRPLMTLSGGVAC